MTFREKVIDLLNQGLREKPSVFLIDIKIVFANKFKE
jgi:ribosome maturation factor RimP